MSRFEQVCLTGWCGGGQFGWLGLTGWKVTGVSESYIGVDGSQYVEDQDLGFWI